MSKRLPVPLRAPASGSVIMRNLSRFPLYVASYFARSHSASVAVSTRAPLAFDVFNCCVRNSPCDSRFSLVCAKRRLGVLMAVVVNDGSRGFGVLGRAISRFGDILIRPTLLRCRGLQSVEIGEGAEASCRTAAVSGVRSPQHSARPAWS